MSEIPMYPDECEHKVYRPDRCWECLTKKLERKDEILSVTFRVLVRTFIDGRDDRVRLLAHETEAAMSTVRRWADGVTRPMPGVMAFVAKRIEELSK